VRVWEPQRVIEPVRSDVPAGEAIIGGAVLDADHVVLEAIVLSNAEHAFNLFFLTNLGEAEARSLFETIVSSLRER
jgi:hypothetical protein